MSTESLDCNLGHASQDSNHHQEQLLGALLYQGDFGEGLGRVDAASPLLMKYNQKNIKCYVLCYIYLHRSVILPLNKFEL